MHKVRKLTIYLCTIMIAFIMITSTAQAQTNYRKVWLQKIQEWTDIIENDASDGKPWKYKSGAGEITNYETNRNTQRYTNCALFVTHALQRMGVLNTSQKFYAKSSDGIKKTIYSGSGTKAALQTYCDIIAIGGKYTTSQLIQSGELDKGDIVCFYGMQHTVVYNGLDQNGRSIWYDAGRGGTSTGKSGGIWNKTYSLIRIRYVDAMTSYSWKVNDIIRFREPITTKDTSTTSKNASASSKNISNSLDKNSSSSTASTSNTAKTSTIHKIKNKATKNGIAFSGISYKIKNKKLYLRFGIKNTTKYARKIHISYLLGTKSSVGTGRSTKTLSLLSGKKKSYSWIKVSILDVTKSRCYLTLKASSGKIKTKIRVKVKQ